MNGLKIVRSIPAMFLSTPHNLTHARQFGASYLRFRALFRKKTLVRNGIAGSRKTLTRDRAVARTKDAYRAITESIIEG